MTALDLLKVFMFIGIVVACCGIRWLSRLNEELDAQIRRESQCIDD